MQKVLAEPFSRMVIQGVSYLYIANFIQLFVDSWIRHLDQYLRFITSATESRIGYIFMTIQSHSALQADVSELQSARITTFELFTPGTLHTLSVRKVNLIPPW